MSSNNRQGNPRSTSAAGRCFPSSGQTSSTNTNTAFNSAQCMTSTTAIAASTTVTFSSTSVHAQHPHNTTQPPPCPYHNVILQPPATTAYNQAYGQGYGQGHDQAPLARFLAEGPGEQSALYNRPDNGQTSLARGCTCGYQQQQQVESFFEDVDAAMGYGQQK